MNEQKEPIRVMQRGREATVISAAMTKTVVVEVVRRMPHPKYKKFVKRKLRYMVHDGDSMCSVGDVVLIVPSRRLSKKKRWRVCEIVKKNAV